MNVFFVITGHGRSGTKYMSELMQYFRHSVSWQKRGKAGISSFHAAHPTSLAFCNIENGRLVYTSNPRDRTYVIQVVRNPWKVVESDVGVKGNPSSTIVKWYPEYKGNTALETSIRSVVLWNKRIASFNPDLVVKVEEAEAIMQPWLESIGHFLGTFGELPKRSANHIDHPLLTASDYDDVAPEVMKMLKNHCGEYGYSEELP